MSELLPAEGSSRWHERLAVVSPFLAGRSRGQLLGAVVTALVGAAVAVGVAWWLFRAPPPPVELALPVATTSTPTPDGGALGGSGGPGPAGGAGAPTTVGAPVVVVVQAAGAVRHPGVYELPADARVADLLVVAGGPAEGADPDRLTLAAPLVDGQRVYVPRVGEDVPPTVWAPSGGASPGAGGPPTVPGPLDLNTADAAALDTLPGVGPATATAIVGHRERSGPYRSVDDLLDVPGIGPAKLAALRDLVRV